MIRAQTPRSWSISRSSSMWEWFQQFTRRRSEQTFGLSDALLEQTTNDLQRLRAALVLHHEQVELALLDLDRLVERARHARTLLKAPLPATTLAPVVLSADKRQREAG